MAAQEHFTYRHFPNGECHILNSKNERQYDLEEQEKIDQKKFEIENKYIEERFPNTNFTISISLKKLKEKLTDQKEIIVKQHFFCSCWGCQDVNNRPPNKYFIIQNDNMTIENVIDELIKQNLTTDCDHQFLEGFDKETDIQYSMFFGS